MKATITKVALIDLKAQYAPIRDQILAAVTRVCDSQQFILGAEVDAFEAELAGMLGVKHAIGVSSGTDALLAALMALEIGRGDEVITSPYSFFATAGCIARVGARPVFVDIDPATFNIDASKLAAAITPCTKAVMPVHLYGQSADLDGIREALRSAGREIPIIEDAAQAIGARYKGRPVGSFGALGCFSFFPSKNLGGFGDGGLVTATDDDLAQRIRLLRAHGAARKYFHALIGGNFRLDALQAAVLRVKAPHLAGWTAARRRNADRYRDLFARAGLVSAVGRDFSPGSDNVGRDFSPGVQDPVVLPPEAPGCTHIYNQFVIRVPSHARDRLRAFLSDAGIGTEVYYPVPFHLQHCFAYLGHREGAFPESEKAARETVALPIYAELSEPQQAHVVDRIRAFLQASAA